MTLYCPTCKIFRQADLEDFLNSRKTRIVCGQCNTVLTTRQEIYEETLYDFYQWEV